MEDYFLGVHQAELTRLERQHLAWLPETERLIHEAGLRNCERILDLGCGPGFTTFMLAQHCPNSVITGLDKANLYQNYLRHKIETNEVANIKSIRADVLDLAQQDGLFDAAFCRWFLAFLITDLSVVLQAIYDKLKPGGIFVPMEYLTLDTFTTVPPNKYFDTYKKAWKHFYLENGGDANIGTYLPDLLKEIGFTIEYKKCVGGMSPVNHRLWSWWKDAFDNFAPTFVEQGLMSQEDFEGMEAYWKQQIENRDSFIYTAIILQMVARK